MTIPAVFYFISKYFKNIKLLLIVWAILLLFNITGLSLLQYLPISIDRLGGYLSGGQEDDVQMFLNIPINFFIYSVTPIFLGIYFVLKKRVYDEFYLRMLVVYIFGSCLYIVFFKANFAVRFAYLSEFLMPILMIYPLLKFNTSKIRQLYIVLFLLFIFLTKAYKIFIL